MSVNLCNKRRLLLLAVSVAGSLLMVQAPCVYADQTPQSPAQITSAPPSWSDQASDATARGIRYSVRNTNHFLQDPLRTEPKALQDGTSLPNDLNPLSCAYGRYGIQPETNPWMIAPQEIQTQKIDTAQQEQQQNKVLNQSPLTLSEAMDVAICHNPQLRGSWAAIKVQAAALGEARAAYLPTITGSAGRMRDHTYFPNSQQPSTTLKGNTIYASLSWRLLDFGGRAANQRSAVDLLNAALADHDAALQKTLTDVISAYFDAQTAQATLQAKVKEEQYASSTLESAQRRETKGAGAETDTLQAQTALSKTMLERSRAQGTYRKDLSVLIYALGIPATTHLTLCEDLEDTQDTVKNTKQDLQSWLDQAKAHHPAIRAAQAQVDSAQEKVISTRSEGLPSLDLTGNFYQNGRPNQGLNPTRTEETLAGVTLNIPLFSGFSQTYKVKGAEAQVEQKQAALNDTEQQIYREVVKAHADAMAALDNLQYSQNLLTAAQKALASVQRKFDKGASNIQSVLSTQSALADAQQQRIQCMAEWRSARLRLLTSVGVLGVRDMQE
jgi:outer membrane protein